MSQELTLVLGGARSGKSSHAEKLAAGVGQQVLYVATAQAGDDEMRDRIEKHQGMRPSNWRTVEAPTGVGEEGESYNINADTAAGDIAAALKAEKLLFLTDVAGILDRDGKLLSSLTPATIATLKQDGVIDGGMLPKVDACLKGLEHGVAKTHIIDGREPHAVLLELFTDRGVGTEIHR